MLRKLLKESVRQRAARALEEEGSSAKFVGSEAAESRELHVALEKLQTKESEIYFILFHVVKC